MKKLLLFLLIPACVFGQSVLHGSGWASPTTPVLYYWRTTDTSSTLASKPWADARYAIKGTVAGVDTSVVVMPWEIDNLVVGGVTAQQVADSIARAGIGTNGSAGKAAWWVSADSLAWKSLGSMAFADSNYWRTLVVSGGTDTSGSSAKMNSFNGTATIDTTLWPGMKYYDIVTVGSLSLLPFDTLNIWPLSAHPKTDTLLVTRKYGNESGQKYSAIRFAGILPLPTAIQVTLVDSVRQATYDSWSDGMNGKEKIPITISTLANGLLLVQANSPGSVDSVALYDGATRITALARYDSVQYNSVGPSSIDLWYLKSPPSGTRTVIVYYGSTNHFYVSTFASTYSNVSQSAPFGTASKFRTQTSPTHASITLADKDLGYVSMINRNAITNYAGYGGASMLMWTFVEQKYAIATKTGVGVFDIGFTHSAPWDVSLIAFPIKAAQ